MLGENENTVELEMNQIEGNLFGPLKNKPAFEISSAIDVIRDIIMPVCQFSTKSLKKLIKG